MTQPQANQKYVQLELPLNPNQHLIDMGFTQDEIDYAFDCGRVYPCQSVTDSVTEEKVCNTFEISQNDLLTEIVEQTESVQQMSDGRTARPPVVTTR
jgi:hypothetical protein